MASPTGQELRDAVSLLAGRLGYGKLYERLLRLNAFVSRKRPPTPEALADRLYNLTGGLRRQIPATIAFHTVWAECLGPAIGEEREKTLGEIADRINATLSEDQQHIQPDKTADLAAALADYEQAMNAAVGPQAARLDMVLKAVLPVAEILRAQPLPVPVAPASSET